MRRAVVLLGLGALIPPISSIITTAVVRRSWAVGKES